MVEVIYMYYEISEDHIQKRYGLRVLSWAIGRLEVICYKTSEVPCWEKNLYAWKEQKIHNCYTSCTCTCIPTCSPIQLTAIKICDMMYFHTNSGEMFYAWIHHIMLKQFYYQMLATLVTTCNKYNIRVVVKRDLSSQCGHKQLHSCAYHHIILAGKNLKHLTLR